MTKRRRIPPQLIASVTLAAALAATAAPAQASLVGDTLSTVDGVVGSVGDVLRPTGWLIENGTTSLDQASDAIGATAMRNRGYSGTGVGVALIDTGVVPVPGLTAGNIVNGPDLSFESQSPDQAYLDTFGHGTHMAGIIAGNEPNSLLRPGLRGIAPNAKLTSVKVGSTEGAVDVSQVMAAIDWVVTHRNDDPQNPIRVINLSYGTDGVQPSTLDPLAHAVENAWRAGIVVVVAGGNSGTDLPHLNNPATDPYVLAVGASDLRGTPWTSDDTVPAYSSRGDASRRVDLVAPGKSIVSLRNPGSYVDDANPSARVGESYFKGSGSSQAAAVTSGAVALLLQARPELTPDQVKALLRSSASAMPQADAAGRGTGELNVLKASQSAVPANATQTWPTSTGLGSLEQARGTVHVGFDGVDLTGERHILGAFDAATWAPASTSFSAWTDGTWAGSEWTSGCYCSNTWTGTTWSGKTWKGETWTGKTWKDATWTGKTWKDNSWTGKTWKGDSWTGKTWKGNAWTSAGS